MKKYFSFLAQEVHQPIRRKATAALLIFSMMLSNTAVLTSAVQVARAQDVLEFTSVTAGAFHSLALKSDGTVWAWGRNDFGQLGIGNNISQSTPVQVQGLSGATRTTAGIPTDVAHAQTIAERVIAIEAGNFHTLFLKDDGTVWASGLNTSGQLGNGTRTDSNIPVQVLGLPGTATKSAALDSNTAHAQDVLERVVGIAAGSNFSMARTNFGRVFTWGNNQSGQLGNGTTTNSSTPVEVTGLTSVTAIAGGGFHAMAISTQSPSVSAGLLTAHAQNLFEYLLLWGANESGQLGYGTTTNSSTPVEVTCPTCPPGKKAIAAGPTHSGAVFNDGTAWA